jgi:hypothetical protein
MNTRRQLRAAPLALAFALIVLALPSSAFGQATRTWVSGVGDDANPCSRTAPCKTFPGAISKTATGGEINCLDPGGFGGVTITKSITIKCQYTEGGVLVSGTNAIVVNAATTSNIVLRGLDINGLGTGINGVRVISAKTVKVLDSEIYGFTNNGVDLENSGTSTTKLGVYNTHIHDITGNGVTVAPTNTATGKGSVRNNLIEDSGCGVVVARFGMSNAFGSNCGTATSASGNTATATINATGNNLDNLGIGAFSRGSGTTVRLGANAITNNTLGVFGLDTPNIESWGDNYFGGNNTNGGFGAAFKG